ncbi:Uncharacterised protein [Shigella sonnei]|nr:Uncharacterised protein [Shigella sonnei]
MAHPGVTLLAEREGRAAGPPALADRLIMSQGPGDKFQPVPLDQARLSRHCAWQSP